MDVLKSATITNADFFHIWFGMRGVAAFRISWDFFLEQKRLLDLYESRIINRIK